MKRLYRIGGILAATALVAFVWTIPVLMLSGCGKKGMPKPPSGDEPPAVNDLSYSIRENTIKLSWTIPQPDEKAKSPVIGFLVFRSKQMLIEDDCPNCPIRFLKIGELPAEGIGAGQTKPATVFFTQRIEPGFRYIYKIRTYDEDGVAGNDSNFLNFVY